MAVLDDDAVTDLTPVEGGLWSSPGTGSAARRRRDFQSLYEQERARADAAEMRCEELRQAEVSARSDAGDWKWHFKSCRRRLSEAEEETKELRRSVKERPSLQAEAVHLRKLVWQVTGLSEDGRVVSLRDEVARLHKALAASEARKDAAGQRIGVERPPGQTHAIRSLRKENTRLDKELARWRKATGQLHEKLGGRRSGRRASGRPARSCRARTCASTGKSGYGATPRPGP